MGYKCTFMDNDVYYAKDVNAVFSKIVSEGVVLKDSGNVLSDLNDATAEVVSEGVQSFPDSCRLTLTDGVYKIGEGVCFMPDGSAITFDADGYEITPLKDKKSYVYIKRNDTMNTIDVVVSEEAGGDGSVPIAEIDLDGTIYDKRQYSTAKVRLCQEAEVRNFTMQIEGEPNTVFEIDVENGNFSRIIINECKIYNGDNLVYRTYPAFHNCLDIVDEEELRTPLAKNTNNPTIVTLYITKIGTKIQAKVAGTTIQYKYIVNFDVL